MVSIRSSVGDVTCHEGRATGFVSTQRELMNYIRSRHVGFCASEAYSMKYRVRIINSPVPPNFLLIPSFLSLISFSLCRPDEGTGRSANAEMMCPRFPEPLPLEHPIPSLKEALEKVRGVHRRAPIENMLSEV